MHKSRGITLAGVALLVLLVAGCATGPTRLESAYGTSYHFARVSQTLSPQAADEPRTGGRVGRQGSETSARPLPYNV